MKKSEQEITSTHYYHPKADAHFDQEISKIKGEVLSLSIDMANQNRPSKKDDATLFIPRIRSLFETFLQQVFKIIGALSVINNDGSHIREVYRKEQEALNKSKGELLEDQRVLLKELKHLPQNLKHIFTSWRKWFLLLIALSGAETLINWKILLMLTPNAISAFIVSLGIATTLFIIAHSLKNVVFYFKTKLGKWLSGIGVTMLVIALLYAISSLRKIFLEEYDEVDTEAISIWLFVAINFSMWSAGAAISLIHKPLGVVVDDYKRYKRVKDELDDVEKRLAKIDDRLSEMVLECNQKLKELDDLCYMGGHYYALANSYYLETVAHFKSENILRRKDGVSPEAFLEDVAPLTSYFESYIPTPKNI